MHVAIDGVGNVVGGGWSVLTRTVRHLAEDDRVSRVSVFCSPLHLAASSAPRHAKIDWLQHRAAHRVAGRLGWLRRRLDVAVGEVDADVVLTMNGVGATTRPNVAVLQQAFMVWGRLRRVRPHTFAAKLAVLRREVARSINSANAVVVQTNWMRDQVAHAFGAEATVLPLGLPVLMRDDLERERNVVVVGHDLPYKRHNVVRRAVKIAQGQRTLRLDRVDDAHPEDVPTLLARAGALIVASDVESLGLPIVEAFATGCPVIVTDRAWSRAVSGDAALYFEHGAADSAAERLLKVAIPDVAADLADRGRQRLAAMWEAEPYAQLIDLLESVA